MGLHHPEPDPSPEADASVRRMSLLGSQRYVQVVHRGVLACRSELYLGTRRQRSGVDSIQEGLSILGVVDHFHFSCSDLLIVKPLDKFVHLKRFGQEGNRSSPKLFDASGGGGGGDGGGGVKGNGG